LTRPTGFVALMFTAAVAGHADQDRPMFRATSEAVLVDVSVTDGRSSVANLKPADFDIRDNGVAQTVTDLDFGHLPVDVRLVFDISGSLSDEDLARHTRAMRQLETALEPGDRCEASAFSRRAVEIAPLGEPPVDINIGRNGRARDGTAFFDAVGLAMVTSPTPGRRQLTIVLSDGNDTSSFYDAAALVRAALRTDAVVYGIAPATSGQGARVLETLATTAGGRLIRLEANGNLGASFLKALEEFRQSYVLHYTPVGVARAGWHDLAVSARGNKKYVIRAKKGYDGGS
jgi:VWFA-related protein